MLEIYKRYDSNGCKLRAFLLEATGAGQISRRCGDSITNWKLQSHITRLAVGERRTDRHLGATKIHIDCLSRKLKAPFLFMFHPLSISYYDHCLLILPSFAGLYRGQIDMNSGCQWTTPSQRLTSIETFSKRSTQHYRGDPVLDGDPTAWSGRCIPSLTGVDLVAAGIIAHEGFGAMSSLQIDWNYACRTCRGNRESISIPKQRRCQEGAARHAS